MVFSHIRRHLRTPLLHPPRPALSAIPTVTLAHRALHTTPRRLITLPDPTRSPLFYHLLEPPAHPAPAVFALSFLPIPPAVPHSRTVIGYLPALPFPGHNENDKEAEHALGRKAEIDPDGGLGLGLNDFRENPAFLSVLHDVVRQGVAGDAGWAAEAVSRHEGYMPISDARNPPMPNRTPEPEDTLAMVRVEDGKIAPETYEPMPTYRLCTSDGVVTLSESLEKQLIEVLEEVHEEERREAWEARRREVQQAQ